MSIAATALRHQYVEAGTSCEPCGCVLSGHAPACHASTAARLAERDAEWRGLNTEVVKSEPSEGVKVKHSQHSAQTDAALRTPNTARRRYMFR